MCKSELFQCIPQTHREHKQNYKKKQIKVGLSTFNVERKVETQEVFSCLIHFWQMSFALTLGTTTYDLVCGSLWKTIKTLNEKISNI